MDLQKLSNEELLACLNEWLFTSSGADGHSTPADLMAELTRRLALTALTTALAEAEGIVGELVGLFDTGERGGHAVDVVNRARSVVEQCREAGCKVFVKQIEVDGKVVHDPAAMPADLRVRELPGGGA